MTKKQQFFVDKDIPVFFVVFTIIGLLVTGTFIAIILQAAINDSDASRTNVVSRTSDVEKYCGTGYNTYMTKGIEPGYALCFKTTYDDNHYRQDVGEMKKIPAGCEATR
jgi:hypothetical protein